MGTQTPKTKNYWTIRSEGSLHTLHQPSILQQPKAWA
jgi:hypothetical protein